MTLLDLLSALRRRWTSALVVFVVIMALTVGITFLQQPTYQASSRVLISPAPSNDADTLNRRLQYLQGSLGTYSELVSSEIVAAQVAERMVDASLTSESVKSRVTGHHEEAVNLVGIEAEASTPEQAAELADTTAEVLSQVIEAPEELPEGAETPLSVTVVDTASKPSGPVSPRWPVNLLIGGVIALVAAITAAVLAHFQHLSRTRHTER